MYRPQRRTMVPTEVAFQDNHPRAKAVLPVQAPKTVDVPASYSMDSPAVHYHYHESPVRMYEHEIPQVQSQYQPHAPIRMGCECWSRESRKQHEAAILFWILTVVAMGLVIIGLIIALCCVSSKRTSYDYPMMSLLQQRYRQ